ncbi:MAG: hypothetical protein CUN53_01770 [Phototrophicales bacterium]|nr:MAG: hypothetical protein CUN53_01770 [Phototrophicales bacterium]
MQTLDRLIKLAGAASSAVGAVGNAVQRVETLRFPLHPGTAFYLHAERAVVSIARGADPSVRVEARWQPPFAWRVVFEQDDAGIYVVALRSRAAHLVKSIAGGLLTMRLDVLTHHAAPIILRLDSVRLTVDEVSGMLELTPDGLRAGRL